MSQHLLQNSRSCYPKVGRRTAPPCTIDTIVGWGKIKKMYRPRGALRGGQPLGSVQVNGDGGSGDYSHGKDSGGGMPPTPRPS